MRIISLILLKYGLLGALLVVVTSSAILGLFTLFEIQFPDSAEGVMLLAFTGTAIVATLIGACSRMLLRLNNINIEDDNDGENERSIIPLPETPDGEDYTNYRSQWAANFGYLKNQWFEQDKSLLEDYKNFQFPNYSPPRINIPPSTTED